MEQPTNPAAEIAAPPTPDQPPPPADRSAPAATPASAPASPPDLSEPLLRLYLLTLATLGGYLGWQMYRLGRGLHPSGPRDRRLGGAWALAVLFAPAACALLFEITRLSRLRLRALGVRVQGGSILLAPLLYGAVSTGLMVSRLETLWTPLLLLMPLPFLIAQSEVNQLEAARAGRAMDPPTVSGRRGWWRWVVVGVGLPAVAFLMYSLDRRDFRALSQARRLVEGMRITEPGGLFTLEVPSRRWEQTAPGVVGDGDEALGFRTRDAASWLVVYVTEGQGSMDDMVAERRQIISESGAELLSSEERRTFLPGSDLVPASYARHAVRTGMERGRYLVLSAILDRRRVEVIGYSPGAPMDQDLKSFVDSLREVPPSRRSKK